MQQRFAGVSDGHVLFVSTHEVEGNDVLAIPDAFNEIPIEDVVVELKPRDNTFVKRHGHVNASNMKVALVGNWKMRCGISTYAEQLWPEVAKHVGDVKLFVEKNEQPTGPMNELGNVKLAPEQVVQCWKRGESLQELVQQLKAYDPDVVWIQHEFGLWPSACHWLAFMSQVSRYRTIVTMHSVFHHRDKTIMEAAMPEIVVHLDGGKDVLVNEKCIMSPVHVIPHGCTSIESDSKLWNAYRSEHTFLQTGFGFAYKGWELSIRAAAELKKKYDDVFFTGLFSESPFCKAEHQVYYEQLEALVKELGVENNVALIRGYQSDATLDSYLRTNAAAIFPYVSHPEHEVFGVSGAARYAMTKAIPIVTTRANHFSDLPTLKGNTPQELASLLDELFCDCEVRSEQLVKQRKYVEENTWEKCAKKYVELFESET